MRIHKMNCDFETDADYIPMLWQEGFKEAKFNLQTAAIENLISYCTREDATFNGFLANQFIMEMSGGDLESRNGIIHMMQEHYDWTSLMRRENFDNIENSPDLAKFNSLVSVMNKWCFRFKDGQRYHIAEHFCRLFMSRLFPSITFDMIPKGKSGYVKLPFSVDIAGEPFDSFYYNTFSCGDLPSQFMKAAKLGFKKELDNNPYEPHIFLSLSNGKNSTFVAEPHMGSDKIMDWLDFRYGRPKPNLKKTPCAIMFFLSLICYIHSGDPDIREFRNKIRRNSRGEVKPKDRKLCPGNINLVGFDWKKTRLFDPRETEVAPYPAIRWKGSGAQKTPETVWVSGHTRNYGKNGIGRKSG